MTAEGGFNWLDDMSEEPKDQEGTEEPEEQNLPENADKPAEPVSYYKGVEALARYPRHTKVIILQPEEGKIHVVPGNPGMPSLPVAYLYPEDAQRGLEQAGYSEECLFGKVEIGKLYDDFPAVYLVEREGGQWHNVFLQPKATE